MIGEMHCHTNLSLPRWVHRTLPTPKELINRCADVGLEFVCITDHDTQETFDEVAEYGKWKGVIVVPAVEITTKPTPLMRRRAHILAYGVAETIPSFLSVEETIELIHAQGGLAVIAHPFTSKFAKLLYIGQHVGDFNFDGIEVFNSAEMFPEDNLKAQALAVLLGLQGYCGSDSHNLRNIGHSRMEVTIPKTTDWRLIVQALKERKCRLHQMQYNNYRRRYKFVHWALRNGVALPRL